MEGADKEQHPPRLSSIADSSAPPWQSGVLRDHPLVGAIWDTESASYVGEEQVFASLAGARFALLGEKHDNPDHHVIQARLLGVMIEQGRRSAVAFEMIEPSSASTLQQYLQGTHGDASGLGEALDWRNSGWPAWSMYHPIAEVAMNAGLLIVPANLLKSEARKVVREGLSVLGKHRLSAWTLDRPLPSDAQAALDEEMRASHCHQLPEEMIRGMSDAQRARDAAMASALIENEQPDGAVLIAGNGHIRTDRGVPFYLAARRAGAKVVSVGVLEVERGLDKPEDYARLLGTARLPYSFVFFTPRVDEKDPCAQFHRGESAAVTAPAASGEWLAVAIGQR